MAVLQTGTHATVPAMPSHAESAVMSFFFAMRAARKRRTVDGEEQIRAAIVARLERQEAEGRRLDDLADRAAYDAALDG